MLLNCKNELFHQQECGNTNKQTFSTLCRIMNHVFFFLNSEWWKYKSETIIQRHEYGRDICVTHDIADLPGTDPGSKGQLEAARKSLRSSQRVSDPRASSPTNRKGWKTQLAHRKAVKQPGHPHRWTQSYLTATNNMLAINKSNV